MCLVVPRTSADMIDKKGEHMDYWDAFDEEGMHRPIRGFVFHIDTGTIKPIAVKPPRFGPHESRILLELVGVMDKKGILEEDFGPYAALPSNPLEKYLHVHLFGRFNRAKDKDFAFDRVEDIWGIQEEYDEEEDDHSEQGAVTEEEPFCKN